MVLLGMCDKQDGVEVYFGLYNYVFVRKRLWTKGRPPLVCLPENRVGAKELGHKDRGRYRELWEKILLKK